MKQIWILVAAGFFLFSFSSRAQVLLEASTFGSMIGFSRESLDRCRDTMLVVGTDRAIYTDYPYTSTTTAYFQGIIEFNITTIDLPISLLTENNFEARLYNVDGEPAHGRGTIQINLYDLADDSEDDRISEKDYGNILDAGPIATSSYNDNGSCGSFSKVDVTDQLKRDLFGKGKGNKTTGFILISQPASLLEGVTYYQKLEDRVRGRKPALLISIEGYEAELDYEDIINPDLDPCRETDDYEWSSTKDEENSGCAYTTMEYNPENIHDLSILYAIFLLFL